MRLAVYGQNGEHIGEVASDEWGEMALYDSPWKLNEALIEAIDDLLNQGQAHDESMGADPYAANQNRPNELLAEVSRLKQQLKKSAE